MALRSVPRKHMARSTDDLMLIGVCDVTLVALDLCSNNNNM